MQRTLTVVKVKGWSASVSDLISPSFDPRSDIWALTHWYTHAHTCSQCVPTHTDNLVNIGFYLGTLPVNSMLWKIRLRPRNLITNGVSPEIRFPSVSESILICSCSFSHITNNQSSDQNVQQAERKANQNLK